MPKYLTEFIGTFFLVLTVGLTVGQKVALAPIAIGGVLMVMIFMGGHISGGHYNPAVSLAVFIRGRLPLGQLLGYWGTQLLAGVTAATFAWIIMGKGLTLPVVHGDKLMPALLGEFIFTFALALVVLNVATAKGTANNSFYGLAIGSTVMVGACAVGGISGGAFNPAVGLGVASLGGPLANLWLHLVGPLAGGFVAGVVFRVQNPDDR
jgi:aquaporin Z